MGTKQRWVTPRRAAIIAGLLDEGEDRPDVVRSAVGVLRRRIRAWNRANVGGARVLVVVHGRELEAVEAAGVQRMQESRAVAMQARQDVTVARPRVVARGSHSHMRRLPEAERARLDGGRVR